MPTEQLYTAYGATLEGEQQASVLTDLAEGREPDPELYHGPAGPGTRGYKSKLRRDGDETGFILGGATLGAAVAWLARGRRPMGPTLLVGAGFGAAAGYWLGMRL